ncbi:MULTISPECIES: Y-family DNA polymerase [unclassified Aureimonas]|uniref:Y-family DNA polymerase n=1 Tax=unclassified Aureimonas TaxID=2615206 RepID=UPI0006F2894E|nr:MULTISPECIES: DNA polymerase Y family protein [unclassified Aureimonas]KQT65777.1 DNA repair protein [Aureimonas sp. Leaf427]KQT74776.1 DNA repair protein [Aureimonas sp. Leaf460]
MDQAGALRLSALNPEAEALGLSRGLGVAEARARHPGLDLAKADPDADAGLLEALAEACDRYTPLVALDAPAGLVLDISGCAHLFGGEAAMMATVLKRFRGQGFAAEAAIASHPGTAAALLHGGASGTIAEAGEEETRLAPLPLAALRLDGETQALLARLGLKRIADLLVLPRNGLVRRVGERPVRRLDEALGRARRPIEPRRPVPLLLAERRFAEPIVETGDVERIIAFLAERLRASLEREGKGARRLELSLFRMDGRVERLRVAASVPLRAPERILALFRERLKGAGDELDAGYGYDLVRLAVTEAEAMAERQEDLSGETAGAGDLETLIDRIGARLGSGAVQRLENRESHWPERAARCRPATEPAPAEPRGISQRGAAPESSKAEAEAEAHAHAAPTLLRPLRLLERPEPVEASFEVPDGVPMQFRWRRALHVVRRFEGPERIAPEWWRMDEARTRDYFRVEDDGGRRFWLFRRGFHGEALPDNVPPEALATWFLHGIFA